MDKQVWDWVQHAVSVIGLLIGLYQMNKNNQKVQQDRHEANLIRLTAIEKSLEPLQSWFNFNVINRKNS